MFERALCDLGASINLMPLSIFKRLGLGEARPTTVTLQLADRSLKHPRGIIEDVLVKVDKFIQQISSFWIWRKIKKYRSSWEDLF